MYIYIDIYNTLYTYYLTRPFRPEVRDRTYINSHFLGKEPAGFLGMMRFHGTGQINQTFCSQEGARAIDHQWIRDHAILLYSCKYPIRYCSIWKLDQGPGHRSEPVPRSCPRGVEHCRDYPKALEGNPRPRATDHPALHEDSDFYRNRSINTSR